MELQKKKVIFFGEMTNGFSLTWELGYVGRWWPVARGKIQKFRSKVFRLNLKY